MSRSVVDRWVEQQTMEKEEKSDEIVDREEVLQKLRKKIFYQDIFNFIKLDHAERKQLLVNDKKENVIDRNDDLLDVDSGDDEYFRLITTVKPIDASDRKQNGWGEVLWESYGPTLVFLESMMVPHLQWKHRNIKFSTFAIGYNWMQSNRKSGLRIKRKVEEYKQFLAERHQLEFDQIKVIMITHSMGGIATRSACVLDDMECDAVIHGAMPTHGSPATYYNAHCGYPLPASLALGGDAPNVSAILGFCQGGLELLPNQHYVDSKGDPDWLKIENPDGSNTSISSKFPGIKIYDFYKNSERWYDFIHYKLLAPESKENEGDDYIKANKTRIAATEKFHLDLDGKFHPHTTMIYSCNGDLQHQEPLGEFASHDNCRWQFTTHQFSYPFKKIEDPNNWQFYLKPTYPVVINKKSDIEYNRSIIENRTLSSKQPMKIQHAVLADPISAGDGTVQIGSGHHASAFNPIKKIAIESENTHQNFWQSETAMLELEKRITQLTKAIHSGAI
ncbi:hypothetical protein [Pelagibaculum spongiae]|uniref:Alpha/beta hydrolase n=1 Tax=Pelagibaculum spongiae TaxID=2080658 RepID=A0A2V1GQ43_9GAMM|nr:hypothetical protein [Pelagibaculum spongiae]PVZ65649.1 hypothetical protein DC094_17330 [Pelagibaculum spongiae]